MREVENLKQVPNRGTLVVGKPCAAQVSSSNEYRLISRSIIPAMLYGMAVEDWLKGILVASIPKSHREVAIQIEALLKERISDDLDFEESFLETIRFFETPEGKKLAAKQEMSLTEDQRSRYALLDPHKKHNLVRLAKAAGLEKFASPEDFEYLEFLSAAIMMGRYPANFKPEQNIPWADGGRNVAVELERWDSIGEAIFKLHDSVLYGHDD